jgi:hypothetical protein
MDPLKHRGNKKSVWCLMYIDGDEWSASRPGPFTTRKIALGTHIGSWVGPKAGLNAVVRR